MTFPLQLNQRHLLGGVIALGLFVAVTFIYVVSAWYLDWQLAHHTPAPVVNVDVDANARLIAAIPDQHLFGLSATGDMPVTNLQLRVTGIARETDANNTNISKAYISIAGSPSKIFQVGDTLPDGVKIYEITSDTVILENAGQLEKLPLPREKLEFKPRDPEPEESY
jgi:type II secretory pathway component PulC